jgi:chromosome segregation ATPase
MKKLLNLLAIAIFLLPVGSLASPRDNIRSTRGEESLFQIQANQRPEPQNAEERKKALDESLEKYKNSAQEKRLENLKNHGLNSIEVRLGVINNFVNQIESNKRFDNETKEKLIEDIQVYINQLLELRDQIEAEDDIEKLKELIRGIHKDLKIFSIVRPKQSAIMAIARIQGLVNRIKNLESKIENLIALHEEKGQDTTNLDLKLNQLRENLELAEEKISQAKKSFESVATNKEQSKTYIEEGRAYLLEARSLIKETREILKSITKELKGEDEEEDQSPTPVNETEEQNQED